MVLVQSWLDRLSSIFGSYYNLVAKWCWLENVCCMYCVMHCCMHCVVCCVVVYCVVLAIHFVGCSLCCMSYTVCCIVLCVVLYCIVCCIVCSIQFVICPFEITLFDKNTTHQIMQCLFDKGDDSTFRNWMSFWYRCNNTKRMLFAF